MTSSSVPTSSQTPRGDYHSFSIFFETVIIKHSPDATDIDVEALLDIIEDIFSNAMSVEIYRTPYSYKRYLNLKHRAGIKKKFSRAISIDPAAPVQGVEAKNEAPDDFASWAGKDLTTGHPAYLIRKIICEISCKCLESEDYADTTKRVLDMVSSYSWESKVVLALAGFAVYYGDFQLVAQLHSTNSLAKSVSVLHRIPEIVEHADCEGIDSLMANITEVIRYIVSLRKFLSKHITPEESVYKLAANELIPGASYWIIRTIVAIMSQIMRSLSSNELVSVSTSELPRLADKLSNIFKRLMEQRVDCQRHVEIKEHREAYQSLCVLFEETHDDNMKIIERLIPTEDGEPSLLQLSSKKRVSTDVLRRKNVLLFITEPIDSVDHIRLFNCLINSVKRTSNYEIVWFPVVHTKFPLVEENLPENVTLGYSLCYPELLDAAVAWYIQDVWHFDKKPKVVVLDPQGRVLNTDALNMIIIWGAMAFPLTRAREVEIWKNFVWRTEWLTRLHFLEENRVFEGKLICFYGGEDMEWIQKFTSAACSFAEAAQVPLQMVYVSKRHSTEKSKMIMHTIIDKLYVLPIDFDEWYFWACLESMWHSKMQLGNSMDKDPIMQEIATVMSFDSSEEGWALMGSGEHMAKAKGDKFLACLEDFNKWKDDIKAKGFMQAFKEYLQKLQTPHHCNWLAIPRATESNPDKVVCPECGRALETFIMYSCSHQTSL